MGGRAVMERLVAAIGRRDLGAFVDCFAPDYRSEQPAHPGRAFTGRDQVEENWGALFAAVPGIRGELLRTAEQGDEVWAELRIHGPRADGTALDLRGVVIAGVAADRIAWARLYLEDAEHEGPDIRGAVQRLATGAPPHRAA